LPSVTAWESYELGRRESLCNKVFLVGLIDLVGGGYSRFALKRFDEKRQAASVAESHSPPAEKFDV